MESITFSPSILPISDSFTQEISEHLLDCPNLSSYRAVCMEFSCTRGGVVTHGYAPVEIILVKNLNKTWRIGRIIQYAFHGKLGGLRHHLDFNFETKIVYTSFLGWLSMTSADTSRLESLTDIYQAWEAMFISCSQKSLFNKIQVKAVAERG
ncbi:hypothetical protein VCSRO90_2823 [Vibrio cholerae]|uniref:DUF2787 family protein n=1 Tax=Vibrio cholerae TaxID=666 RepID=UPI0016522717|nr:DUF2787 family protein [Vibrio cholerae]GIB16816.1 hypothetical protein VCSRO90_2823 [Vibrio cholerae]HDI3136673.1 DUF2787 family protein [Vibrio cholerae]